MVRFARAKGSKASNERLPEEATSWQEMKQQMIESRQKKNEEKVFDVREFLEDDTTVESQWATFEDNKHQKHKKKKRFHEEVQTEEQIHTQNTKKKRKDPKCEVGPLVDEEKLVTECVNNSLTSGHDVSNKEKKKKKKKTTSKSIQSIDTGSEECYEHLDNKEKDAPVGESKDTRNIQKCEVGPLVDEEKLVTECVNNSLTSGHDVSNKEKKKKKKKTTSKSIQSIDTGSEECYEHLDNKEKDAPVGESKDTRNIQKCEVGPLVDEEKLVTECVNNSLTSGHDVSNKEKKKKKKKTTSKSIQSIDTGSEECHEHLDNKEKDAPVGESKDTRNIQKEATVFVPKNTRKQKKGLPYTSRKPFENIMRIGQREVELAKFDGFPIKKEDFIRLKDLEKKMRDKNIPEAEIKSALKLERRRAEKALTRERKKVCFHCREPGHMLSNCPSIDESPFQKGGESLPDTANSGICFKCGSTEHTHLQCRVVKGDKFRFATCFVCKEQGHISRQCQYNQNGLYPKGGACNICGEVTHLKKDCPKFKEENQSAALTLPTLMDSGGLEDLDGDSGEAVHQTSKKSSKKVVKF